MSDRWVKLFGSGEAEAFYLVKEKLPKEAHLYSRELRELLASHEPIADRWPSFEVFGAFASKKHEKLDFAVSVDLSKTSVSRRARECLEERLSGFVEWLPVRVQDGREFFIPQPLRVVDALDTERSSISVVSGYPMECPYITAVHNEWMHEVAELEGVPIFRTPETANREAFISVELAEFIESEGLVGASFDCVQQSPDG